MCHSSSIIFALQSLHPSQVKNKKILEIGSLDFNGGVRDIVMNMDPKKYVGIDIQKGPGVDYVMDGEDVVKKFGKNSFDIVIATELMEHTKNWREVISNMKNVLKPEGTLIITTRSKGFNYHAYPYDYWRYEIQDMRYIFSDFKIQSLKKDHMAPGVFLKAIKPKNFKEKNLENYRLYSIVSGKKVLSIEKKHYHTLHFYVLITKNKIVEKLYSIGRTIFHKI